MEYVQAIS